MFVNRNQAGMCAEPKLTSNWLPRWYSQLADVASLRVRNPRHRSSSETFFARKICSWTELFVNRCPTVFILVTVDRDSSVCISTRWGLKGPRFETRWGRDFPHSCTPTQRPTQPPAEFETDLFSVVKTVEARRWLPTPSIDDVKERVGLYHYSVSRPSWPILG
jgi:hypothetical protein